MKKYLNTPEEVIKALKDGKEVKDKDNWSYKLVDGLLTVFFDSEGEARWLICNPIRNVDEPYIEEAEPLKFEVGKFYKSRNGEKWICGFVRKDAFVYPVRLISQCTGDSIYSTLTGKFDINEEERDLDIIGEWED